MFLSDKGLGIRDMVQTPNEVYLRFLSLSYVVTRVGL